MMPTTCEGLEAGVFEAIEGADLVNSGGPEIVDEGYYWSEELALMQALGGIRCNYASSDTRTGYGIDGSGSSLTVAPLAAGDRARVEALLQQAGYSAVGSGSPARSAYATIGSYQSEYDPSTFHVVGDQTWISVGRNFTAELEEMESWANQLATNVGAW